MVAALMTLPSAFNKKDVITKQSNHVDSALANGPIRI